MQTTIIEYAEQFELAETDGATTTITETSASLLQNSLDVETIIGLETLLKGDAGIPGEAMTENSTFITDPLAYYILAKL
jgi:hypothetical protein